MCGQKLSEINYKMQQRTTLLIIKKHLLAVGLTNFEFSIGLQLSFILLIEYFFSSDQISYRIKNDIALLKYSSKYTREKKSVSK